LLLKKLKKRLKWYEKNRDKGESEQGIFVHKEQQEEAGYLQPHFQLKKPANQDILKK